MEEEQSENWTARICNPPQLFPGAGFYSITRFDKVLSENKEQFPDCESFEYEFSNVVEQ
jgi:hypothetical protein